MTMFAPVNDRGYSYMIIFRKELLVEVKFVNYLSQFAKKINYFHQNHFFNVGKLGKYAVPFLITVSSKINFSIEQLCIIRSTYCFCSFASIILVSK